MTTKTTQGRSIRLFLVDGTPGLLTAEIMNWTGHVLTGPRSRLSDLVQRPEVGRTGIYFLVGPNPKNSFRPLLYIGESDDVGKRLKQHNKPENQNGKDFWEKVCLVTSKDQNLSKPKKQPEQQHESAPPSPVFVLEVPKHHIAAQAQEIDGEFFVLQGSSAREKWVGKHPSYQGLYQQLVDDGVLLADDKGNVTFSCDHGFSSPSAAAAVISGRSANGRIQWLVEGKGQTYGAWQDEQVSGAETGSGQ